MVPNPLIVNSHNAISSLPDYDATLNYGFMTLLRDPDSQVGKRLYKSAVNGRWQKAKYKQNTKIWERYVAGFDSLADVATILKAAAGDGHTVHIPDAALNETTNANAAITERDSRVFIPRENTIVHADIDGVEVPAGSSLIECARIAIKGLPDEFHHANFVVQASAGHMIDSPTDARVHLYFLLDEPLRPEKIKAWLAQFKAENAIIDLSVYDRVHVTYLGCRVEVNGNHAPYADPVKRRVEMWEGGSRYVKVTDRVRKIEIRETGTYQRGLSAPEHVVKDAAHSIREVIRLTSVRKVVLTKSRRKEFQLVAKDGYDHAISQEIMNAMACVWFSPSEENTALMREALEAHGIDTGVVAELVGQMADISNAPRLREWMETRPDAITEEDVCKHIGEGYRYARNQAAGAKYKAEAGSTSFGPVEDDAPSAVNDNAPKSLVEDITKLLDKAPREKRLRAYNKTFAQSFIGDKTIIIETYADNSGYRVMKKDAFVQERAGDRVQIGADKNGEPIYGPTSGEWLKWTERRRYLRGIEFCPGKDLGPDRFNAWRGWNVRPSEDGSCDLFKRHMRDIICAGDETSFRYLWNWCAHLFQKPMEKPGVAVALISKGKGTGKSTFGAVLRHLIGPQNAFSTARKDHLTGQFNVHLSEALLVQAEEAFWSQDKHTENVLKDLVTCDGMNYERKGFTPQQGPNYSRVLITSNSHEAVPASDDERRFAVFEVSDAVKQNISYFTALHAELKNGGYERLLHELLTTDLTGVDVRTPPETVGLANQKMGSLHMVHEYTLDWLQSGEAWGDAPYQPMKVRVRVWIDECRAGLKQRGLALKAADSRVGELLRQAVPSVDSKVLKADGVNHKHYCFPPLPEARAAFDNAFHVRVGWGAIEADVEGSPEPNAFATVDDDLLA